MSLLAELEAAFTPRVTPAAWQRVVAALLAVVVLAGGIYPALYQGQLPHSHIFIGGPPPADWEDHQHENPLDYLFGPTSTGTTPPIPATSSPTAGDPRAPVWANGRVVSTYAPAGSVLVVTVVGYAVLTPLIRRFRPDHSGQRVAESRSLLPSQVTPRPATPPPRVLPR